MLQASVQAENETERLNKAGPYGKALIIINESYSVFEHMTTGATNGSVPRYRYHGNQYGIVF